MRSHFPHLVLLPINRMGRRSASDSGRAKPSPSTQERLSDLRKVFLDSLKGDFRNPNGCFIDCGKGKHCSCGHKIIRIRNANTNTALLDGFLRGNYRKRYAMPMGIMFHGTARHSVASICRNGMSDDSYYTSSFHYAVGRSKYKENYYCNVVDVLVLAVLVDGAYRLELSDTTLNCKSDREFTLPLFIITVKT